MHILSSHISGTDCKCKRLACFEVVTVEERNKLIKNFNEYLSKDSQDAYLATLIKIHNIKRRRSRQEKDKEYLHNFSYSYSVRVQRAQAAVEVPVCIKAMMSLFGITKSRIESIRKSIATTGHPPIDGRGKHKNRPHKLSESDREAIRKHLSSFRGRSSHYALGKTKKIYLSENLNVSKMFELLKLAYPTVKVGYETYRVIFNNNFNIGFGFPQKDTCLACDEFFVNIKHNDQELLNAVDEDIIKLKKIKKDLETEHELHTRKAALFYSRKSDAKNRAKISDTFEAIAFDFQKNLSLPNKSTNDVYY
ncbi:uncharacterized protein LOC124808408 [Hydra vulgaris]|uniref:uncharacterized protein LOC124808408 n=1 Tax=Hydra vulgaris TaxID=6087 RepID=UPI001F5EBB8F|nr:uncharacterized protein LOC124808408 [Hydra vulgaris]